MTSKKCSHLSKEERNIIEILLNQGNSISSIANTISRDKTTISKEIKKHKTIKYPDKFNNQFNMCIHKRDCKMFDCDDSKPCYDFICNKLKKSPYVCNGCETKIHCRNIKFYYDSRNAHNDYIDTLSNARIGVRLSKEREYEIESVIYDLIKNKGQSVNEIYINNPDLLNFSKVTFYSYINQGLFHLKNHDLRRKVMYKPRKKENKRIRMESKLRINRTYKDFLNFIDKHPKMNIVEMDTVEGTKGGKVLLTLYFRSTHLMLIYLLKKQTKEEVVKVFDNIKMKLGKNLFQKSFRIILTDNGKEFFDPDSIEKFNSEKCINLFYCDPSAPYQKAGIEKNHEYIRYILPKKTTFDYLVQEDIEKIINNINSSPRGSLHNKSPYNAFKNLYGEFILNKLGIEYIEPNEVNLTKKILGKYKDRSNTLKYLICELEKLFQAKNIIIDDETKNFIINTFYKNYTMFPSNENMLENAYHIVENYINKK